MSDQPGSYYVPKHSALPIVSAIGLFFLGIGSIEVFESPQIAFALFGLGGVILALNLIVWFSSIIRESRTGLHDRQMNRTYYWGMFWFMIAQTFFALVFLGSMVYVRAFVIPGLGGEGSEAFRLTHLLLWPNFTAAWPLLTNPAAQEFVGPSSALVINIYSWISTAIMLLSGCTMWLATCALKASQKVRLSLAIGATLLCAFLFTLVHGYSIVGAIYYYKLTIFSGIYGSLFFMINVVLLLNLLVSTLFLLVVFMRSLAGHFTAENQFSVKALSWLWYFIVALWMVIFVYVYWV
ncbi:MAG: cytochrome c oxidase subunit 3 [Gammaproteobacteria bacterium]|nr:cytochrome c oxidase subunit 3 [Gammaproteobacteria bacterium]